MFILDQRLSFYEVFVHHTAILKPDGGFRSLAEGELVEFDLIHGPKGLQAANVSGPNGTQVKGDPQANLHGATSPKPVSNRSGIIGAGGGVIPSSGFTPAFIPYYNKETDQTSFVYAGPTPQGLGPAPATAFTLPTGVGGYYVPAQWAAFPGAVAFSPYTPALSLAAPTAVTGTANASSTTSQQVTSATATSPGSQSPSATAQSSNTTVTLAATPTPTGAFVYSPYGGLPLVAPAATPETADHHHQHHAHHHPFAHHQPFQQHPHQAYQHQQHQAQQQQQPLAQYPQQHAFPISGVYAQASSSSGAPTGIVPTSAATSQQPGAPTGATFYAPYYAAPAFRNLQQAQAAGQPR
jgi:hypothetical protein